jgi:putative ABC transport system permease protein
MLRNYFIIALRNFRKHKAFTTINLLGLAIAFSCSILIYLFIEHEFTFDTFHTNKECIYRVVAVEKNLINSMQEYTISQPYPLGPAMLEDLPEVKSFVRTSFEVKKFIKKDNDVYEEKFVFADSTLFSVFSFPLLYGNPAYALNTPNAVVISEKVAGKYFGDTNPLGQTLSIRMGGTFEEYEVTAVFRNIPSNSSIHADFFLPMMKESVGKAFSNFKNPKANLWYVSSFTTYVLLQEKASATGLEEKLARLRNQHFPDEAEFLRKRKKEANEDLARTYLLQNLTDIHLNTELPRQGTGSKPIYSYVLAGIAACILLLASINFTLLSISRSHSRAKEVGIRKVAGARRSQLIAQFWGEALLTSFFALVLSLLLSWLTLPLFNEMAQKELSFNSLLQPASLTILLGLTLLTGIIAGAYPSLLLSGLNIQAVFKNNLSTGRSGAIPHLLLATQFVLPLIFLTVTAVMIAQLRFMRQKDLGFRTEHILVIDNNTTEQTQVYHRFKQLAQQQTAIRAVTATDAAFTKSSIMFGMREHEEDKMQFVWAYHVKPEFFDILEIKFAKGRSFNEKIASDSTEAIIVNETFVKTFGWTDPIGQEIEGSKIIGVVEDFHFQSLSDGIGPIVFYLPRKRNAIRYILVKLQGDHLSQSIVALSNIWNQVGSDLPFQYSFLEEDMQALYEEDARWTKILQWISALSVFIACMGLIGVVGLTVAKRTKEIGIRKVLGASVSGILLLLSKDYIKLIFIALLIAIPVANYFVTEWLQNFAYHIDVQWWMFAMPGVLVLLIALLSVTGQTWKAARTNPVESLRNE